MHLWQQVEYLISQTQQMERFTSGIPFKDKWKLLTILIGANNLCVSCLDSYSTPAFFQRELEAALDTIHQNFPRTFVNLLLLMNVEQGRNYPLPSTSTSPINFLSKQCT